MQDRRARLTLLSAILFSGFTIWAVHWQQEQERETMYQGVLRDDERRREKMRKRMEELEESKRKRVFYGSVQKVDHAEEI